MISNEMRDVIRDVVRQKRQFREGLEACGVTFASGTRTHPPNQYIKNTPVAKSSREHRHLVVSHRFACGSTWDVCQHPECSYGTATGVRYGAEQTLPSGVKLLAKKHSDGRRTVVNDSQDTLEELSDGEDVQELSIEEMLATSPVAEDGCLVDEPQEDIIPQDAVEDAVEDVVGDADTVIVEEEAA